MSNTIEYEGMTLEKFTSKEPVMFGTDGQEMVVCSKGTKPHIDTVLAYLPNREGNPVVTKDYLYEFCAKLPDRPIEVNKYLPGTLLCRGKVSMVVSGPNTGKTEFLCKATIQACKAGNRVLYLTFKSTIDAIYRRCAMLLYDTFLPSTEQMNQVKSLVHPGELRIKEIATPISVPDLDNIIKDVKFVGDKQVDLLILDGTYLNGEFRDELYRFAVKHNMAILTVQMVHGL